MSSPKEIIYDEYCAGNCPKCMSDNLQYYTPEEDGDLLSYETNCKDCGLQFFEYYYVKYKHSYGVEYTEQTKENRPMQTNGIDSDALDEIQYSCCGDEMTGILEDVQICPTCKEHQ